MEIVWTDEALAHAKDAERYYYNLDTSYAITFFRRIFQRIDQLRRFPYLGPVALYNSDVYRKLQFDRYIIVYRVDGDLILIIEFFHSSQNWEVAL